MKLETLSYEIDKHTMIKALCCMAAPAGYWTEFRRPPLVKSPDGKAGLSDCPVRRFIARDYQIADDCDTHRMPAAGTSTLAVDVV